MSTSTTSNHIFDFRGSKTGIEMGINGLTKILKEIAPHALKETYMNQYKGKRVAIDGSMFLYSFLISMRPSDFAFDPTGGSSNSHLRGIFYRTTRLIESGLRPVFVFDGAPPKEKFQLLAKRAERRKEATVSLAQAVEAGNKELIDKQVKRTVKVDRNQVAEVQHLLKLMRVPVIVAPSEAEAQCAALTKTGRVFATGTEDVDALTFGTPLMLRNLTRSSEQQKARHIQKQAEEEEEEEAPLEMTVGIPSSKSKKRKPNPGPLLIEVHLETVLSGLNLTMDQFIDFCILCGSDYCDTIGGIGPKRALQFITKHGSIEQMLPHLDPKKHRLPEKEVFDFETVRALFKTPLVHHDVPEADLSLSSSIDEQGVFEFLKYKRFNMERVERGLGRLKKAKETMKERD